MSKDNQERIKDILSLYNKKSLIETTLLNNEVDIIKNRSKVVDNFSDVKYDNLYYNVSATNDRDAKYLYDVSYFHIYNNDGDYKLDVYYIVQLIKNQVMAVPRSNEEYVSFTLSYHNSSYEFVLEVSANLNFNNSGDFLIIKAIAKYDKEIIELINYNTHVTNHNLLYGDEKATINLKDNEVVVHIN